VPDDFIGKHDELPVVDDKMKGRTLLSKAFTKMSAFSAAVVYIAE